MVDAEAGLRKRRAAGTSGMDAWGEGGLPGHGAVAVATATWGDQE